MAKKRRLAFDNQIRSALRKLIDEGVPQSVAAETLRATFPGDSRERLRVLARDEERRAKVVGSALDRPPGSFVNLARVAGCADPRKPVRVGIKVDVIDAKTGGTRPYFTDVMVPSFGRLRDLVAGAVAATLDSAISRNYEAFAVREYATSGRPDDTGYPVSIMYIEC